MVNLLSAPDVRVAFRCMRQITSWVYEYILHK